MPDADDVPLPITDTDGFRYRAHGPIGGPTVMLLPGLFGSQLNFSRVLPHLDGAYRVITPELPLFDMPIRELSLQRLVEYCEQLIDHLDLADLHLVGNSLGGHIALLYTLANPDRVASLTLSGSSGLYESALGTTLPRRGDLDFLERKIRETFYDSAHVTPEMVESIAEMVSDRNKAIRIVATAKSAVRQNLTEKLHQINTPTLLIWGADDNVTPAFVGEQFEELIDNAQLVIFPQCGHAAMIEYPELFANHLKTFIESVS